mgnify:FL=1
MIGLVNTLSCLIILVFVYHNPSFIERKIARRDDFSFALFVRNLICLVLVFFISLGQRLIVFFFPDFMAFK